MYFYHCIFWFVIWFLTLENNPFSSPNGVVVYDLNLQMLKLGYTIVTGLSQEIVDEDYSFRIPKKNDAITLPAYQHFSSFIASSPLGWLSIGPWSVVMKAGHIHGNILMKKFEFITIEQLQRHLQINNSFYFWSNASSRGWHLAQSLFI